MNNVRKQFDWILKAGTISLVQENNGCRFLNYKTRKFLLKNVNNTNLQTRSFDF